jgi:hypothetical protein
MAFRKALARLGSGGATVDTVLDALGFRFGARTSRRDASPVATCRSTRRSSSSRHRACAGGSTSSRSPSSRARTASTSCSRPTGAGAVHQDRDAVGRLRLGHGDTAPRGLAPALDAAVRELGARRGWF